MRVRLRGGDLELLSGSEDKAKMEEPARQGFVGVWSG